MVKEKQKKGKSQLTSKLLKQTVHGQGVITAA